MIQARIIAVGKYAAGDREIQAVRFSGAQPISLSREVVEHRVARWHTRWVAEVRVNGRLTHHSIFGGAQAYADAIAWCEAIAPLIGKGVLA